MLRFVCLVVLIGIAIAGKVEFRDCGKGEVREVWIEGCEGEKCTLKRGVELKVELDFEASK